MRLHRGSPPTYLTRVLFIILLLFSTFHRFPIMADLEEISENP